MSDTRENAFAILEIFPQKLKIKGFGNITDITLLLNEKQR
jgi:hypothetical protein